jgi:hypothetical protein
MAELYIIIAIVTFLGLLRKGFFPAIIGAVLWPVELLMFGLLFIMMLIASDT